MGDHVSGPSLVKATGEPISKIIASDNSSIGGSSTLSFLFKVLSITKPLSIQVHPNKVIQIYVNTFSIDFQSSQYLMYLLLLLNFDLY